MGPLIAVVLLLLGLLASARPVAAQEAEALRKELEQLRQQLESVRRDYQKAIDSMADRLKRLEAAPPSPVPAPAVVQAPPAMAPPPPAPGAQVAPSPPGAGVSVLELARPRQPFALYDRRGSGQLLFDIGIAGDFIGNITQKSVEQAQGGTFAGLENRFFPRSVEVNLFGQIDPYARAEIRIEAEAGGRGEEITVALAEANLTLLTLPWGTQAKLGRMRSRFGLTNERHEDALPSIDRPNALVRFLGDEGLTENGAEFTWLAPLPFYLELLAGVFNGDNETAFGRGSLRSPLATGRVRTFLELNDTSAIQLGLSIASGETVEQRRSTLLGYDVKYKFRPEGWRNPLLTFSSEGMYSIRDVTTSQDVDVEIDTDGDGIPDTTLTETRSGRRTLRRFGWYVHGEVQPWRRWAFGARYDNTQFPEIAGREWAIGPYLTFLPSEFLRFRLGYKHTERDRRGLFQATGEGSARIVDEFLFQATFILGAHPAHPF